MPNDYRIHVAYHEAGHSVAAVLLGAAYGCAIHGTNAEGGGCAGTGDLSEPPRMSNYTPDNLAGVFNDLSMRQLVDRAAIIAAGCVATAICERTPRQFVFLKSADRELIDELARAACGDNPDLNEYRAWQSLAVARAYHVLNGAWCCVESVAHALEKSGQLSPVEVGQIVAASTPGPHG
jgi:hypothetical protein